MLNNNENVKVSSIKIGNHSYKVRNNDETHMKNVANLLHKMRLKTDQLCKYIESNGYGDDRYKRLLAKKNVSFEEIHPRYVGEAAYSINKGDRIGVCVYNNNEFIDDENTMFFVVCHELAHIMSTKYAHDKEFWQNFAELLSVAEKAGLYTYQDYSRNTEDFCGHSITHNPLKKLK